MTTKLRIPHWKVDTLTAIGDRSLSVSDVMKGFKKLGLEFPLLSDRHKEVAKKYGVDDMLMGMKRAYFIVDIQGILRYKHVEFLPVFKRDDSELLAELRKLSN